MNFINPPLPTLHKKKKNTHIQSTPSYQIVSLPSIQLLHISRNLQSVEKIKKKVICGGVKYNIGKAYLSRECMRYI